MKHCLVKGAGGQIGTDLEPSTDRTRILVACLTYKRGPLLGTLLQSFAALDAPEGADYSVLVVDNDPLGSARPCLDPLMGSIPGLTYVLEPRRGIPVARNAALDYALANDFDALCFVDDDEFVKHDWLAKLVATWRETGAQLVGGPVLVAAPPQEATPFEAFINDSLAARMNRKNAKSAKLASKGAPVTVVTNNWLCALRWMKPKNIRFDERQLYTGGSDASFCKAMRAAGAKIVWSPDALVYETMTRDRLTLAYQFHRGASQSNNHFVMKNPTLTADVLLSALLVSVLKFVTGALLLVVPVFGKASPVVAVRSMGWSVGRIGAIMGFRSRLYEFEPAPMPKQTQSLGAEMTMRE